MLIDTRTAQYLLNTTRAIETGTLPADALLSVCPECDERIDSLESDDHAVFRTDTGAIVLIGCEGYWVINPNLVGLPNDAWRPPTDWRRIVARHADVDTNPLVQLNHVEAWREGMMVRVVLNMQNTRKNRSWTCATSEAARQCWREAMDALGHDAASGDRLLIDQLLEHS